MKIIKFGGKSLEKNNGLQTCINLIKQKKEQGENLAVVVSASGNTTNFLIELLEDAKLDQWDSKKWQAFQIEQSLHIDSSILEKDFKDLEKYFTCVQIIKEVSSKTKDAVLAYGEVFSAKSFSALLQQQNMESLFVDARNFIITNNEFGNAQPNLELSQAKTKEFFSKINFSQIIPVITGFIGANPKGESTTLGRNGSNFSASLLANFLDSELLENFTHVDGVFTTNPDFVPNAQLIPHLSFSEANEMLSFGMNILHAKTLLPLIEKNIPIRILNTNKGLNQKGTLISNISQSNVKSLNVLNDKSLIVFEGSGLLGKVGVDARIFKCLGDAGVSISIVSQGSSERGIGLVVDAEDVQKAVQALEIEFKLDILQKDVEKIYSKNNLSVLSIVGQQLHLFHQSFSALARNQIKPLLISNTITGDNIGILIQDSDLSKAINVIHGELFDEAKPIHLIIFGHGTVGKCLINQILNSSKDIAKRKKIKLKIVGIANSKKVLLNTDGIDENWEEDLKNSNEKSDVSSIIEWVKNNHLENLIAIDNTASNDFTQNYPLLVENAFDLVSSNKVFNTLPIDVYRNLRHLLEINNKSYLYETNVGAGLPLIDTIKLLHLSGENITRIKGVFSGTLSYIFNEFSKRNDTFSLILNEAMQKGYTEPDPREDLSGNDVARKLLILARELDLINEFEDISIQNLINPQLSTLSKADFLMRTKELDIEFQKIKDQQDPDYVLRYLGDLHGDLQQEKAILDVKLVSVPASSSLGQVNGSDSIFEIYTESYGEKPIVIMGAGAGAQVTARGVFGDILRIVENKKI